MTECLFIDKFLVPTGAKPDSYGNFILTIGQNDVIWSSHVDTIHAKPGKQRVIIRGDYIRIHPEEKNSSCLGADCTSGVWIMLEMIKARVPGTYIFHRDEERGGRGSSFIAKSNCEILKDKKFAIAFDRKGKDSVITHQMTGRCASQVFVDSIIPMLPGKYKADASGTFTDTANYNDLISECTNISVGYYLEHTKEETQSMSHLISLRDHMVKIDLSKLVSDRNISESGQTHYYDYENGYRFSKRYGSLVVEDNEIPNYYGSKSLTMIQLIRRYPEDIEDILETFGYDFFTLKQEIFQARGWEL